MKLSFISVGDGRLAQTHRPRSEPYLMQDMLRLKQAGVDVLVSCLTHADEVRWGLLDEERLAKAAGLTFARHPIVDHSLPDDFEAFDACARMLADELREGRGMAVHCFAGIGRSGMLCIATLVHAGLPFKEALAQAMEARGLRVPETRAQFDFLQAHYGRST